MARPFVMPILLYLNKSIVVSSGRKDPLHQFACLWSEARPNCATTSSWPPNQMVIFNSHERALMDPHNQMSVAAHLRRLADRQSDHFRFRPQASRRTLNKTTPTRSDVTWSLEDSSSGREKERERERERLRIDDLRLLVRLQPAYTTINAKARTLDRALASIFHPNAKDLPVSQNNVRPAPTCTLGRLSYRARWSPTTTSSSGSARLIERL